MLLAVPLAAEAQQAGKTWQIGWLGDGNRAAREAKPGYLDAPVDCRPLRGKNLRRVGWPTQYLRQPNRDDRASHRSNKDADQVDRRPAIG